MLFREKKKRIRSFLKGYYRSSQCLSVKRLRRILSVSPATERERQTGRMFDRVQRDSQNQPAHKSGLLWDEAQRWALNCSVTAAILTAHRNKGTEDVRKDCSRWFIPPLNEAITHLAPTQHSGISPVINPWRVHFNLLCVTYVVDILCLRRTCNIYTPSPTVQIRWLRLFNNSINHAAVVVVYHNWSQAEQWHAPLTWDKLVYLNSVWQMERDKPRHTEYQNKHNAGSIRSISRDREVTWLA